MLKKIVRKPIPKMEKVEKTYKCEICDKIFKSKYHLDRHHRCVHLGIKEDRSNWRIYDRKKNKSLENYDNLYL